MQASSTAEGSDEANGRLVTLENQRWHERKLAGVEVVTGR
jgi:hypothetical protein